MSDTGTTYPAFFRGRRRAALALTAGAAALAMAGSGAAFAAASGVPAKPLAKIPPAARTISPNVVATGTTVTLGPGGYSSGTATCPADTEVMGGGENNSAGGTLVLTDSWPTSNTTWLVFVKNNGTTTETFTPRAVCR